MDFSPNDPISLFHEDILTDLNHSSQEASNGGLNEFLSQQTIEGDENAEWLSVFVEDCLSNSPSNYNLAPASDQVITKTCNPKPVGNLKPQPLFNSSLTVKNPAEKPSLKRKKKTVSFIELKTHITQSNLRLKTPSNVWLDHSLDPELELEYDPDPPLLQQTHWLADSELIFPIKKDSYVKEESCTEEERAVDVGSPSPEVYIEPKFDMKENMLKPRSCTHCQSKRTPLWREGPLGKGTLCNACGLRWLKSGNLFPEYRPANSPTFMSNRHSNVLRPVLKMREDHHSSSACEH